MKNVSRKTVKSQERRKRVKKQNNILRAKAYKKRSFNKAVEALKKVESSNSRIYSQINDISNEFRNSSLEDFERRISSVISALNSQLEKQKLSHNSVLIESIKGKIKRYENLREQIIKSKSFSFLSDIDITKYKEDPKLFFTNMYKVEEKLKSDKNYSYHSILDTFARYSKEEIVSFSSIFVRFVEYTLNSNIEDNYFTISYFLSIFFSKSERFINSLKDFVNKQKENKVEEKLLEEEELNVVHSKIEEDFKKTENYKKLKEREEISYMTPLDKS